MQTVYVRGRDELAAAILATPLDVDTMIILERTNAHTRYTFPAVCYPDGGERTPHGRYHTKYVGRQRTPVNEWVPTFCSPEQHAAWQCKRREAIAKQVKAKGRKWFE